MVDLKISALDGDAGLSTADLFVMVDVSVTTGTAAGPAGKNVKVPASDVIAFLRPLILQRVVLAKTASYTPVKADQYTVITFNSAIDVDMTLSDFTTENWDSGSSIIVIQLGVGQVYFVPDGGIASFRTRKVASRCEVMYLGGDVWDISGDFEEAV